MYHDGGGLYLQITKNGGRSWIFRYSIVDEQGRRKGREMGLGRVELVSLAEVRAAAQQLRKDRLAGIDPIEARKQRRRDEQLAKARALSFKDCAVAYVVAHQSGWRNAKHADQWLSTLKSHIWPVFGDMAVGAVDTAAVIKALEPIWSEIPETASRVRGRVEAVLDWAKAREFRSGENPARWRGHLDNLLPAPTKVRKVKHHPALPYQEVATFLSTLRDQSGPTALALEFLILTAARTGETIGASWEEISFSDRMWVIPAGRIKSHREHRVPLSARALEILNLLKGNTPEEELEGYIFKGQKEMEHLSSMAMLKLLARMNRSDITVHGFRSTFRDWVSECTDYSREVAEMALAHTVGDKVEAAYRRGDLLEKRRLLMSDWAIFCLSKLGQSTQRAA